MHKDIIFLDVREGDLFNALRPNEIFDVIYWNITFLPYIPRDRVLEPLDHAIYDGNGRLLDRCLTQAKKYLVKNGTLILGYSDTHGSMGLFHGLAQKYHWRVEEICRFSDYKTISFILCRLTERN